MTGRHAHAAIMNSDWFLSCQSREQSVAVIKPTRIRNCQIKHMFRARIPYFNLSTVLGRHKDTKMAASTETDGFT